MSKLIKQQRQLAESMRLNSIKRQGFMSGLKDGLNEGTQEKTFKTEGKVLRLVPDKISENSEKISENSGEILADKPDEAVQ